MTGVEPAESSLATKFFTLKIHPRFLISSSCADCSPQEVFSFFFLEPLTRIELVSLVYEASILPLNYRGMAGGPRIELG